MGAGHDHGHGYSDIDATVVSEGRTGYRQDATELGDARRRVEKLVCDLPAPARSDSGARIGTGDKAFDEPWELRAFALAVAAYHEGHYEWSEFQLSLIDSIKRWEEGEGGEPWSYYEHWLEALETVLASSGALSDSIALDSRTREVLATPRNANHHEAHREPVATSPALR